MFPDQAKNYRTYESTPKTASIAAGKSIQNTAVAGSQGSVATNVGAPGGMKTVIKKTGGKRPGILLCAFIVEKALGPTVTKTENIAQKDALMSTAMVRTRRRLVIRKGRSCKSMLIHEAVKQALETDSWIIRQNVEVFKYLAIKPTNTGFNCIVKARFTREHPCWNPSAEDLMADDWVVVSGDEYLRY